MSYLQQHTDLIEKAWQASLVKHTSSNRKLKNDCLTENTPGIDFSNLSERLKDRFFQKCDVRKKAESSFF